MSIKNILEQNELDVVWTVNTISSSSSQNGLRFTKVNNVVCLFVQGFIIQSSGASGSDTRILTDVEVPTGFRADVTNSFIATSQGNLTGPAIQGICLFMQGDGKLAIEKIDGSAFANTSPDLSINIQPFYASYISRIPVE